MYNHLKRIILHRLIVMENSAFSRCIYALLEEVLKAAHLYFNTYIPLSSFITTLNLRVMNLLSRFSINFHPLKKSPAKVCCKKTDVYYLFFNIFIFTFKSEIKKVLGEDCFI